jgi:hypothetical protein
VNYGRRIAAGPDATGRPAGDTRAEMTVAPVPAECAFLAGERARVVAAATRAVSTRHYASAGPVETRRRLDALYGHVAAAVERRDLGELLEWTRTLARERFAAGYDLSEVQAAFNALEEALWRRIFVCTPADELARTLGLVATAFGAAKDALGREWVELATHAHAPSLDLRALYAGSGGA